MGNPLRDRRTPSELAANGQVIEFNSKISDFERLEAAVATDLATLAPARLPANWRDAPVAGRLAFGFADAQERLPVLDGRVAVSYDAVCQRCLAPFRASLDVPLRLVFAPVESIGNESAEYEAWELAEATLTPLELVDESLVMAMPLAAKHEDDAVCSASPEEAGRSTGKIRPFAALKARMETNEED